MVGDGRAVVVGNGQSAFLVDEVADEGGVEDERLRTHLVAGHALGEGCDFGGGEGGVPDADFGDAPIKKYSGCIKSPRPNSCCIYSRRVSECGVCG